MSRRVLLRLGVALGILLICTPLIGLLGTLIGTTRVFDPWGKSGIGDSHALGGHLDGVLTMTSVGFALLPCGIIILVICVVLLERSRVAGPPPLP